MTRLRKWLGSSIDLSITWGEVLVIVAAVVLINAVWPATPAWVFLVLGFAVGVVKNIVCDLRHWLHRRGTA